MDVIKPLYVQAAEELRKNSGQWDAYQSNSNCVILAGPGSGKTKTLTVKLARILSEDVSEPRGVACITYNNQCARELKKRLSLLGVYDSERVSIGTLHSFCLRHIVLPYAQLAGVPKQYPIRVASLEEIESLQQAAITSVLGNQHRWGAYHDAYRRIHLDRESAEWHTDERAVKIIDEYEGLLDKNGLVDFDGMVQIGLHLVQKHEWVRRALYAKFPVLVVDEYQDLGEALDLIVRSLCFEGGMRLIAVGDPDQSIYGFTGANPTLLRRLSESKQVKTIKLNLNYRCGSGIISASEVALGESRGFKSNREEPGTLFFHERVAGIEDQAAFLCGSIIQDALKRRVGRNIGDIAILYLDKNDGDYIANAVRKTGWKFIRVDGNNPYQPSPVTYWLEDCAAWCSGKWSSGEIKLSDLVRRWLRFNESVQHESEIAITKKRLVRFLYEHRFPLMPLNEWLQLFMKAGLEESLNREANLKDDKNKVEHLLEVTQPGHVLEEFTVSFFGGQGGSPEHLTLTTLHSAKGLEYDVVIMPGLEQGRIPYFNDDDKQIREKRRLFYVGLTRARHEVHFLYSGWYLNRYGRRFQNGRSIFVTEVQASTTSKHRH